MLRQDTLSLIKTRLESLDLIDVQRRHVGVNRCLRAQCLTRMSIKTATLMVPVQGLKRIQIAQDRYEARPGKMLILPPGIEIDVENRPDPRGGPFECAVLVFDPETLDLFGKLYGAQSQDWRLYPQWQAAGSDALFAAIADWVGHSSDYAPDLTQTRHRMAELLLLLARQGVVGNLLIPSQAGLSDRIKHLLALDHSRDWRTAELTDRLGMSESTLRRRLRIEGRSFRDLLEEVRLEHGIDLVMGTDMPINQVAFQCGYASQSRFAERFRKRYSLSPTDLRATQLAGQADVVSLEGRRVG